MINDLGMIPGAYQDANNVIHAFVRFANGTIITFDVPGAGTDSFQGTLANAANVEGFIAGEFFDANFVGHGFVRTPGGKNVLFDAPGEGIQETSPLSINLWGAVTGTVIDANGVEPRLLAITVSALKVRGHTMISSP